MKRLFVIEAPGKVKTFEAMLKKIGVDCVVKATKGHLFSFPEKLETLGIDKDFSEVERKPISIPIVSMLRQAASQVEQIIIATDADTEGDVIAWDVHELLKDVCPDLMRMRLKGMDEISVKECLENIEPIKQADAIPGRTRAIIDRIIGYSFSKNGVGVGRILTALLGVVANQNLSTDRLRLCAPAKDGGRPWVAHVDVVPPLNSRLSDRLSKLSFPALDIKSSASFSTPPMHMGDVMIKAGDELGMTPKETAASMQKIYEAGRLSYPRSGSRGMSKGAQRRLEQMIKNSGFKGASDTVAEKKTEDTHDAPYPIGSVDVSKDPRKLGDDEGVRTLIARNLVKSSQTHTKQTAVSQKVIFEYLQKLGFPRNVCEHIAALEWTREIGPRYPGQESWSHSGIESRMPETVLLEQAVKLGLGKPSTWANHIDGFIQKGLVNDDLSLTEKGQRWVAESPQALLDPRIAIAVEKACERILPGMMDSLDREPWSILAERIVSALPDEIKDTMKNDLAQTVKNDVIGYKETIRLADSLVNQQNVTLTQENTNAYKPTTNLWE